MPIKKVGDMNTYNGGVNHNQYYAKVRIKNYILCLNDYINFNNIIKDNRNNVHQNQKQQSLEKVLFSNLISKTTNLSFSIEQWELIRRLRNSGITKDLLLRAFDDLDRMEKDLGSLFNMPIGGVLPTSPNFFKAIQNFQSIVSKNLLLNNNIQSNDFSDINNGGGDYDKNNGDVVSLSDAANMVNQHFANIIDPDLENSEVDELKRRGDLVVHNEISLFIYKHDLKQSQIARMAGINQAYVSKFLRAEFCDVSENGKTLLYKWYLRFQKNADIYCKFFLILFYD